MRQNIQRGQMLFCDRNHRCFCEVLATLWMPLISQGKCKAKLLFSLCFREPGEKDVGYV